MIRALRPHAEVVTALIGGERYPLQHIDAGLFAVALPFADLIDYRLEIGYPTPDGGTFGPTVADAYRFLPTLGEVDLHLFAEGRHERLWEVLGAHPRSFSTADGVVDGVSFAVWAPNAKGVSLIGDFNGWDGNEAPLRVLGSTGVWELFWPGFPPDGLYKFRDPRRRRQRVRPRRPDGLRHRGAPAHRVARHVEQLRLGRRRLDGAAGDARTRCSSR